ncbi:MAG: hypothetical protein ACI8PZ_001330 [Myxococcota bacterium]|jgi:hypothetical protein
MPWTRLTLAALLLWPTAAAARDRCPAALPPVSQMSTLDTLCAWAPVMKLYRQAKTSAVLSAVSATTSAVSAGVSSYQADSSDTLGEFVDHKLDQYDAEAQGQVSAAQLAVQAGNMEGIRGAIQGSAEYRRFASVQGLSVTGAWRTWVQSSRRLQRSLRKAGVAPAVSGGTAAVTAAVPTALTPPPHTVDRVGPRMLRVDGDDLSWRLSQPLLSESPAAARRANKVRTLQATGVGFMIASAGFAAVAVGSAQRQHCDYDSYTISVDCSRGGGRGLPMTLASGVSLLTGGITVLVSRGRRDRVVTAYNTDPAWSR